MGVNSPKHVVRKSKHITNPKDVDYILSLSEEQAASKNTIMELFADFGDGPRFNTYDTIDIPKGSYGKTKKNKNEFTTTIGLYIFNKGCIEDMSDVLGYINEPITADKYDEINELVSYAKLEDKITIQQLKDFIMQSQIYMSCTSALAPSHTMVLLLISDKIEKKKKQLIKEKYGDAIKNKDIKAMDALDKELLDYAKELLKDDPSADMFNSGARSSWGNNFKNMYVSRGTVKLTDDSYDIITSSYMSGLSKEDLVKANDAAVGGPYSRAVKTKEGGYREKQILYGLQHVKVLPRGSDCGTNRTINVTLTKKNIKNWMYSFVKQGSNLVEITSDNKDKFIGKTVKMRYFSLCESKNGICEKCAGTLFNRLGITNVGLASDIFGSRLKNTSINSCRFILVTVCRKYLLIAGTC